MKKTILHCDLNSFFASVEIKHEPSLRGKPVAVCGAIEDRHGIVLAKTQEAKRFGVSTGEAIWQAKRKCRDLIIVSPHFELYEKYSVLAKEIYYRYTDQVESFGIDECWLDVTGSKRLFGDGVTIANTLREDMKNELGLTISVGVSFNKIFAKLGSDMKKPDATSIIPYESFKNIVWKMRVEEMMGIGRATKNKLNKHGIYTLGQLAQSSPEFCRKILGKPGEDIWCNANGYGSDIVARYNNYAPVKSVGRGNTFDHDLTSNEEVRAMLFFLSEDVALRLRNGSLLATKIQITVKNEELISHDFQAPLSFPSQSWAEIGEKAYEIFIKNFTWDKNVRSLTVRAIDLMPDNTPYQLDCFCDHKKREKTLTREITVDKIRQRYGLDSIETANLIYHRARSPAPGSQFDTLPKLQLW
ncbi:MAG: DNA polymerase IV [Ruminococcaceae bacterium]|nr:DNA polymerase IV [Oscillospiraceae bacterium]